MGQSPKSDSAPRRRLAGALRALRANYAAYLTLIACLAITIFAWRFTSANVEQKSREAFSVSTKIEKETVGLKVKTYLEALRGLRNFLSVTPRVGSDIWRDYISTMDPDGRFHGIHEIVFAQYVTAGGREKFPVRRVYPFEDAGRLMGRDLGVDETGAVSKRKVVMEQARDSGEPRALAVQFGGIREGFELVLAVYNTSPVPSTIVARRRALRGFVILTFSMRELLSGVFSSGVVYSLDSSGTDDVAYTEIVTLNIAGEKWNLYFSIPRGYSEATDRSPLFVLIGGVIFSLLLFGIVYSLSNARLRAVTMAEDMTVDLREARDIATAASRAKSDFLASMSHEIRTPMNAIIGMGELLRETPLTAEQTNYIDVYKRASETLQSLINDILDLSRIESGQLELEEIRFDLPELVESTAAMFRIRTDEKGLYLKTSVDGSLPRYVLGDPTRLRQILINLVGNSIKFTETGGISMVAVPHASGTRGDSRSAGVHASADHARILFSVTDTGIGIPADKTETIFESFSQVDSSTTRKYGGTGLGLDICRRLTEKMDGDIWVESDYGSGSTFKFTALLGIASAPEPAAESSALKEQAPLNGDGRGLRILLAEDSADNRLLISAYMKGSGHVLEQAENGEEAVNMFQNGTYDIILMDVQMPVMDGYQATRRIRELEDREGLKRTTIIALTAHALTEYVEESKRAGCDDHLTKPIKKQVLLEALAAAGKS